MPEVIEKFTIQFLKNLSKNNNRDWFGKNKDYYLKARENVIYFVDALISKMNIHDRIQTQ